MKNATWKTVFIILLICATIITLGFISPSLIGTLIFIVIGVIGFGFYWFQPFSEFSNLRKLHPIAKNEIDRAEKILAQKRADINAREKIANEELVLLVKRLQEGRDKLMEIEKIRLATKFNEQKSLSSGFEAMADTTTKNLVKAFLELSDSDANDYFSQTSPSKDDLQATENQEK
jgi:hypothetical protein